MGMSEDEKRRVLRYLDQLGDGERKVVLASLEAFVEWMADALASIYVKVRNFVREFFKGIQRTLGFV